MIARNHIRAARYRALALTETLCALGTEGQLFGFLGEPRVNVLALNLALDAAASK